jgi:hypothetical protein
MIDLKYSQAIASASVTAANAHIPTNQLMVLDRNGNMTPLSRAATTARPMAAAGRPTAGTVAAPSGATLAPQLDQSMTPGRDYTMTDGSVWRKPLAGGPAQQISPPR